MLNLNEFYFIVNAKVNVYNIDTGKKSESEKEIVWVCEGHGCLYMYEWVEREEYLLCWTETNELHASFKVTVSMNSPVVWLNLKFIYFVIICGGISMHICIWNENIDEMPVKLKWKTMRKIELCQSFTFYVCTFFFNVLNSNLLIPMPDRHRKLISVYFILVTDFRCERHKEIFREPINQTSCFVYFILFYFFQLQFSWNIFNI